MLLPIGCWYSNLQTVVLQNIFICVVYAEIWFCWSYIFNLIWSVLSRGSLVCLYCLLYFKEVNSIGDSPEYRSVCRLSLCSYTVWIGFNTSSCCMSLALDVHEPGSDPDYMNAPEKGCLHSGYLLVTHPPASLCNSPPTHPAWTECSKPRCEPPRVPAADSTPACNEGLLSIQLLCRSNLQHSPFRNSEQTIGWTSGAASDPIWTD